MANARRSTQSSKANRRWHGMPSAASPIQKDRQWGIDRCVTYQDYRDCLRAITMKIVKKLKGAERRQVMVDTFRSVVGELKLQAPSGGTKDK
jgi:hypothetical protein